MKKQFLIIALAAACLASCSRTGQETWEDTKTCGRYFTKGFKTLMGQHEGSQAAFTCKRWSDESEFIPMHHGYQQTTATIMDMEETIPAAKESPGDPGCQIPGIDGFSSPRGRLAQLFANIHFETDQYTVLGEENLCTIQEIAHYLNSHPTTFVFIEGHADERGAAAYNLSLGSRRANSVRTALVHNGVNPDQLFTVSYGKEKPLALGHDANAWEKNRRAQFKLYER
jgi:peptidoglycan-associated lipoprotein